MAAGGGGEVNVVKVDQLRPGATGLTLTVKVVNGKTVNQRPLISESIVGDETGVVVLTARNDQVELVKEGTTITLRDAKIDLFRGSMRLIVDRNGRIEVTEGANIKPKEDLNMSLIEYKVYSVTGSSS